MKSIHPTIMENMENSLVKYMPHTSICESHNASISAMLNLFHNIRSASVVFLCHTKRLHVHRKLSPICGCEERIGAQREHHDTSIVAAAVGEKAHLGMKRR